MQTGRFLRGAAPLLLSLTGACSALVETETKQCKPEDTNEETGINPSCQKLNADYPLTCSPAGLCVQTEGLECLTSVACEESSDDEPICDLQMNRCVRIARCDVDGDCDERYGLKGQICEEQACRKGFCTKKTDCDDQAAGFICSGLRCVEPQWECASKPDPRLEEPESEPIFEMQIVFAPALADTPVENLHLVVCAAQDIPCIKPLFEYNNANTEEIQYDRTRALLTLKGLDHNKRYNLLFEAQGTDGQELVPGKYMMHRPVVGLTREPKPIVMFVPSLKDGFALTAGERIAPGTGLLFARIFDCDEEQLPGIQINTNETLNCSTPGGPTDECKTRVFYFNSSNIPQGDNVTETDEAGRAGIINMAPDKKNIITCTRASNSDTYTEMDVYPRKDGITYVNFYPGDF